MPEQPPDDPSSADFTPTGAGRILLDNAQMFLGLLELDGRVIEVNQRVKEIHTAAYEQVLGHPIWESPVWPPEERLRVQNAVQQAAQGEPVQLETRILSAEGVSMTLDFSLRPWWDDTGNLKYLISEGHNVTQRKQLDVDREQERLFLQAVLDNIADGIAACDAKGVVTVFNPASRTFHNLREFPIPVADWAEHYFLFQPDGLTPLKAEEVPLFRVLQGEVVRDAELIIAPKGGKRRCLLANAQPIICPAGNLLGAVVALHDITVTREAELALRESEEHYRVVMSSLNEGVVEQDKSGHIVMANAAAERLLGLTRAQLLGRDNLDPRWRMIHQDGTPFPGETHPAMTALRTGKGQEGVILGIYKPDGALTWLLVNCQPLWRTGGTEPDAVVSSMMDITQLKQTEAQLRYAALHDDLTGLPTATLFRTRLEQAVRRAERDPEFAFAVLYIDLDGFKIVNDTLGHSIGDNLLVTVARQLEQCVRGDDVVTRLGDDEFAVLFEPLSHPEDASNLAERVLQDLAISLNVGGREVRVSASVGVALSGEMRHPRDLLAAADAAMYQAKAAGKAQYVISRKPSS